ncbi:MAG: energy transducer TonB [Gemmatimonadetes bacterium]|nr:energy transducer TonB [Gemmatimonadota bacterium]
MHPADDVNVPAAPADPHSPRDATRSTLTANDALKLRSESWLARSITIAVLFHVAVFTLSPDMMTADEGFTRSDMTVIIPPVLDLPPQPPPMERPAEPIIGSLDLDADVTISPTTPDAWSTTELKPPVRVESEAREGFERFVPSMVAPRMLNPEEVERELRRRYPSMLRDVGIGGDVDVNLWLDETGAIVRSEVSRGSGYDALDDAALKVVDAMRLSPARNRGVPVRVIVTLPVRFRVN